MKIAEFNPNDRSRSNECLDGFLILFIGQTHTLDKEASHTIILQTRKEDIQLLLSAHLNASHTKEGLCIEWSYSQRTDTFLLVFIATVITKNSQEMKLGHYFLEKKKNQKGKAMWKLPFNSVAHFPTPQLFWTGAHPHVQPKNAINCWPSHEQPFYTWIAIEKPQLHSRQNDITACVQ